MHLFSFFPTNQIVSAIWEVTFTQNVHAVLKRSVHYIEVFLWEFDRDSVGFLKKCPLLPGVRYVAYTL